MPDPQNATGTPPSTPPPDTTVGPDLAGLRTRPVQPAPESLGQTLKRNLTPELDTSKTALGPGHFFDQGDSPQQEGEQQYREKFGSPLQIAYGHAKQFLQKHEGKLSEKYLAPFRSGLDNMASDLQRAAETGRTASGGQLNPVTRGLVGAAGAGLRMVPVGKDVRETAAMAVVPPELGPEGKALAREIKAGERVAPNLEGLRTREISPAPQKSPFRIAADTPEKHAEFQEAVKNTEGAELHDKGLTLDVARQQKPGQAGERAIRTGVFFLPEKKSPYQRYYTTGRQGYGGSQRIEGRTTFENPIIAKGASGGKVPERVYDAINGKDAYDEMRQDVLDATSHSFGYGEKDPKVLTQRVADVLEKHGGNPEFAADIVRTSKEGNQLAYAIQEHIVASSVRKAGHDGIIGYSKVKGQHRLSEVFDLRRDKYPISSQLFESSPKSPDLEGLRTREVSPATAVESKVVSPAKEVPKPPQHEAVGIHSDDLPRRAKYQDVDFSAQDLQDSGKNVTPETIRKDYAGGKKDVSVYQAHIPMEDLPSAKFVEPEEENFDRGEYSRPRVGVPIKVAVNKDGSMEILDGNHRVQTWEEQGQEYAPAWVVDRRGPGIEKLSEDEIAERAEEEAERQKPVTPFEKINLSKDIPNDEAVKTEVPISKLSVSNKAYGAAESDIAKGRGSKTEGPVQVFHNPDNKQFLVADGMHRVVEAHQKGVKTLPAQLWSGYSDYIANVRPEELKSLGSQTEQAAKSLYTPEGAQPLAEKLGAKVVGSVTKKESERVPNAYGSTKPRDLDLRIEGEYKPDEILPKLKAEGFEPVGSSVVSPEEIKQSGKPYGKPGWKRAEHFENAATGEKLDFWHDEPESATEPPPLSPEKASSLAKTRSLNLKHLGDPITEMDPNNARNWIGYDGSQETIKVYRGVDAKGRTVEPGDFVTTSKESAAGYGPHVVEMEVPASDLRYVQGHQNGDPNRVGQGGQVELLYAPKKGGKAAPKAEPKIPLHEKLFSEALKGQEKTPAKAATRTTLNASGESAASQEAINRAASEKTQGIKRFVIDTRSGAERPVLATSDAVDLKPQPYEVIVSRKADGQETLLDSGVRARPYKPKR